MRRALLVLHQLASSSCTAATLSWTIMALSCVDGARIASRSLPACSRATGAPLGLAAAAAADGRNQMKPFPGCLITVKRGNMSIDGCRIGFLIVCRLCLLAVQVNSSSKKIQQRHLQTRFRYE
jgi:hypothetical protein